MRIALFAHSLRDAGGRSVGMNLLSSLPRVGPEHDFLLVVPSASGYDTIAGPTNSEIVEAPRLGKYGRFWWEISAGRRLASEWGADWVVALGNIPMRRLSGRAAVLIHDPHLFYPMRSLEHLNRNVRMRKRLVRAYLRRLLPRQNVVFAQTTVAADRIERTYGIADAVVVPNALSALITEGATNGAEALDLPDAGFRFLTLTKYAGRKGLETLVAMFEQHGYDLRHVMGLITIDAAAHSGAQRLMKRVSVARLGASIMNLGPVDQRQLASLYAQVDAMVLPSRLESYSGTYVEAMALGVPIITSDRDFAHVVCGDAAIYVDPTDPGAIAQAINRLASNPELRSDLVRKGRDRASRLGATWDDSAGTILSAMENASDG